MHDVQDPDLDILTGPEEAICAAVEQGGQAIDAKTIYAACSELFLDSTECIRAVYRLAKIGRLTEVKRQEGRPFYRPGQTPAPARDPAPPAKPKQGAPAGKTIPPARTSAPSTNSDTDSEMDNATKSASDAGAPTGLLPSIIAQLLGEVPPPSIRPAPAPRPPDPAPPKSEPDPDGNRLIIGDAGSESVEIDLARLLNSRMLITSASGGGKSWALRRLLEQTAEKVQQLIIDPEGEFASLAEKHAYVVCNATDSEIRLHPDGAYALAHLLMRNRISAVLDISDLDPDDRHTWVANFITGLMCLPQEDWHHVLVVLDESHLFAPQHDKSEAKKAVIDLAGRGRKRGLCPVLATQRFSKLNKNVVAELQNRLIGQATLDLDIRRAADELGIPVSEAAATLPELNPGEFFTYGPAICRRVRKVRVGEVYTTHGAQLGEIAPPAPSTPDLIANIAHQVNHSIEEAAGQQRKAGQGATAPKSVMAAKATGETEDEIKQRIAMARHAFIAPVLAARTGTKASWIEQAAAAAAVNPQTIQVWLKTYRDARTIDALRPERLRESVCAILGRAVPAGPPDASPAAQPARQTSQIAVRVPLDEAERQRLTAAGVSKQRLRLLEYLRSGASDAEIAKAMRVRENYVQTNAYVLHLILNVKEGTSLRDYIDQNYGRKE